MTEDVISLVGLVARTWAEDIVQLQHTRMAHNTAASKSRAAIIKAFLTSLRRRKEAWCRRHDVEMTMLEWLTDNGGHLESTYELYSYALSTRRAWALTITRQLTRQEYRMTTEDDDYGLLRELSAEINRLCGGDDTAVVVDVCIVDLPAHGQLRAGKGMRFVPQLVDDLPVELQFSVFVSSIP